jgi:hypothetical protein
MKYKAPSGADVDITISDYSTAFDLTRAILKAVRQGGIGSKIPESLTTSTLAELSGYDIKDLGGIADALVDVIVSPEVEALAFKCMERCTYDDHRNGIEKISRATFEPEDRRGDFPFVAFEVVKENIRPFASHLTSGLKGVLQKAKKDSQK